MLDIMKCKEIKPEAIKIVQGYGQGNYFDNSWVFERKYDGSRHIVINGDIVSKREICRNDRFNHIAMAFKDIKGVFDCEIYIPNGTILDLNASINWSRAKCCVFDVLEYNGINYKNKPLCERKQLLSELFSNSDLIHTPIEWSDYNKAWSVVKLDKLEGLIAKKLSSKYEYKRSSSWNKIKLKNCIDVDIIGHEAGKGHGTFIIKLPNGVEARLSGTSMGIVSQYKNGKTKCEINYMYFTNSGIPFQPTFNKFIGD